MKRKHAYATAFLLTGTILAMVPVTLASCSHAQRVELVNDFVACGKVNKGELLGVAVELGATLWRALSIGADQKAALKAVGLKAAGKGLVVGGCAGAQFLLSLIREDAAPAVDGAVARSYSPAAEALEELRAQFGGKVHWSTETEPVQ